MKKTILDENEVTRILNMHKLLKEQGSSTPSVPTQDPNRQILVDAKANKCLVNGQIGKNHPRTKGFYFRGKKQSTGQEVDFFPDMTYEFVDGSKKGKWKCDNIAINAAKAAEETKKTQDSDTQKQAFINKAKNLGYKETLSADDVASGEYKKYKVPGSEP
jgi:hypothetical protein